MSIKVSGTVVVDDSGVVQGQDFASAAQGSLADSAVQPNDSPTFAGLTVDSTTLVVDSTNDRVGIGTASPTEKLHVSGNILASGNVTAYSDERLKSNIQTIPDALDKVSALRGVTYEKEGVAEIGVIAQEVQKVLPEVVQEGGEYLSVAYGNIVGVLVEAIKELHEEVADLKAKVGGPL